MKNPIGNLNKIFDSRIRLGVMSILLVNEEMKEIEEIVTRDKKKFVKQSCMCHVMMIILSVMVCRNPSALATIHPPTLALAVILFIPFVVNFLAIASAGFPNVRYAYALLPIYFLAGVIGLESLRNPRYLTTENGPKVG